VKRRGVSFVLLVLGACAASCGRRSPQAAAPEPPTAPSLEARREAYRPPADGKLTDKQVERYLSVLEKVRAARRAGGAPAAAPSGDALDMVSADVAAARAQNQNAEEYLWVKERILEAEAAIMAARLNTNVGAMVDRTLADLKAKRADAADEASRKLLSEQIASFEAEAERLKKESREREPESIRANIKTIEPFREKLAGADEILEPHAGGEPGKKGAAPKTKF
jgi:hypothetical protein